MKSSFKDIVTSEDGVPKWRQSGVLQKRDIIGVIETHGK